MKFSFNDSTPSADGAPSFPTADAPAEFPAAPADPQVTPTPGVAEWLWNPPSVQAAKLRAEAEAETMAFPSFDVTPSEPAFPSAELPVEAPAPAEEAPRATEAKTQPAQDEWQPRPGVLVDHMRLLVKQRQVESVKRQDYAELINKLKLQYPEIGVAEAAISNAARAADNTHFEVEALARKYKQGAQVPGCKVSFSDPKTKVCEFVDLVAAWPTVEDVCPEVIKKGVDVKALQAAAAAGRTPDGLLEKVVKEKSTTSEGRLKIEVTL